MVWNPIKIRYFVNYSLYCDSGQIGFQDFFHNAIVSAQCLLELFPIKLIFPSTLFSNSKPCDIHFWSAVSPKDQIWKFWMCSMKKTYFRDSHLTAVLPPDPPKVTAIHLVESSPTSLSLQWSVSHRANPVATRYELMYRKKVSNNILFIPNT